METFNYSAINETGHQVKGRMAARNDADLEIRLQQMGLDLITVQMAKSAQHLFAKSHVSHRDLVMFCFQLEQLIEAGVPILDGLSDLKDNTENAYFQTVLGVIFSEVEGGKMLSEALLMHANVFDAVFVSLIAAGEKTGQLPTVLHHLSHALKWQDALFSQTKRLLTYPLFIFIVVLLAVIFLMVFLVPEVVTFMGSLGQTLPLQTKILISISNAFVHYWWLILAMPIVLVMGLIAWVKKSTDARYRLDGLKLKLPVFGEVFHKVIMARFSRYFALMYQTGIPILDAIKICEEIVGNQVVAVALSRIHDNINAGERMSDSFHNTGLFPSLVVRMIKVGEHSGALDKSLMNISYFYDRDVDERLQKMLTILEPALTVILGLVLMFIMVAVLGPVYNAFSQMPL